MGGFIWINIQYFWWMMKKEVIQVAMRKISWEGTGVFQQAGHANKAKALEMVEEFQPGCGDDRYPNAPLWTEWKCPAASRQNILPRKSCFTGFDEFEYAKGAAVHLGGGIYSKTRKCSRTNKCGFTRLKIKLIREISEKAECRNPSEVLTWIHFLFCRQTSIYVSLSNKQHSSWRKRSLVISPITSSLFPDHFSAAQIHTSSNLGACEYESSSAGHLSTQAGKRTAGRKWRAKCFSYLGNTNYAVHSSGWKMKCQS